MDDPELDLSLNGQAGGPVPAALLRRPGTSTQPTAPLWRREP